MKKILLMILMLTFPNLSIGNERFIPLELFTGGEIRDDNEIKFTPADKIFGEKRRKKIVGPIDWKDPGTDEIIKVYKRTQKNTSNKQHFLM